MKKQRLSSIITCIGCLLILLMSACGDDSDDDADDDHYNDDYDDPEQSRIKYPHLEEALAEALGKVPGEEITPDELATLTHLTVPEPHHHWGLPRFTGWHDIALLAHCINLKELDLSRTPIADFSPLAGLTRLERLSLHNTVIFDLQPLAGLVNLQWLDLSTNEVKDLTALAGMIQLKELNLSENPLADADITPLAGLTRLTKLNLAVTGISDLEPLAGLVNLQWLNLSGSRIDPGGRIHDITPLANLIQIDKLYLHRNMIVDLKPLVDNPGLVNEAPEDFDREGDTVTVNDNPLSDVSRNIYIPALQARGVDVRH